ncbi:MAG: GNAT family N-acetyltransferase [Archangium sp.]|nr:GNAT family N-acetyltransferase [Archangium sp.]
MTNTLATAAQRLGDVLSLHRTLRQPTGLQFAFADRIDLLNTHAWDELARHRGLMMSRDALRAVERSGISALQTRYALAFREGQPVAAVAMQLLELGLDRMHALPKQRSGSPLDAQLRQRVLICGSMLSGQLDGVAFAPGETAQTRWRAVAEAMYRVRQAEKLTGRPDFVLIKDLDPDQHDDSALLHQLSYRTMATEPNMVLTLKPEWTSHADYLAGMTSKYRSSVKQAVLKPMLEAGCTVERLTPEEVEREADRIQTLYLAVHDNAAVRPITATPAYWRELAALGPERILVCGLRHQGALVGFILVRLDGETVSAAHVGIDRELAKSLPLYLRLLHAVVEVAISHRAKRAAFGRTALEPKARLGCTAVPTVVWARHRQPVLNSLVRGAFGLVTHAEAPVVNPFKRDAAG